MLVAARKNIFTFSSNDHIEANFTRSLLQYTNYIF